MERYGISVNLKNIPELDPDFMPLARYNEAFLENATKPISIAVERADGQMAACHTKIHESAEMKDEGRGSCSEEKKDKDIVIKRAKELGKELVKKFI
mgnify:CR=1 FL=1